MGFHDQLSVLQCTVEKHEHQVETLTRLVENLRTVLDRLENSMHALQSSAEPNDVAHPRAAMSVVVMSALRPWRRRA